MPTPQHTCPQIPSPSPPQGTLVLFLAFNPCHSPWPGRWRGTGGVGSRGRSREGRQNRGMLKEGTLGWMDLNRSKKLLSVIPGSGGEKEGTGKGRLDGELGRWGREDLFIPQSLSRTSFCPSQPEPGPEKVQ